MERNIRGDPLVPSYPVDPKKQLEAAPAALGWGRITMSDFCLDVNNCSMYSKCADEIYFGTFDPESAPMMAKLVLVCLKLRGW